MLFKQKTKENGSRWRNQQSSGEMRLWIFTRKTGASGGISRARGGCVCGFLQGQWEPVEEFTRAQGGCVCGYLQGNKESILMVVNSVWLLWLLTSTYTAGVGHPTSPFFFFLFDSDIRRLSFAKNRINGDTYESK